MLTEIYCRFTIIDYTTRSFLSLKCVYIFFGGPCIFMPTSVAARSKAWDCSSLHARWVCEFETRWGHGCLCLVSVVMSGRGLCDGSITRPGESYRVWCVWVWPWILDNEDALVHYGVCCVMVKKKKICQPNDDPAGPKHVAVWILCKKTVFRCLFVYLFLNMFWF